MKSGPSLVKNSNMGIFKILKKVAEKIDDFLAIF